MDPTSQTRIDELNTSISQLNTRIETLVRQIATAQSSLENARIALDKHHEAREQYHMDLSGHKQLAKGAAGMTKVKFAGGYSEELYRLLDGNMQRNAGRSLEDIESALKAEINRLETSISDMGYGLTAMQGQVTSYKNQIRALS